MKSLHTELYHQKLSRKAAEGQRGNFLPPHCAISVYLTTEVLHSVLYLVAIQKMQSELFQHS